MWYIQGMKTTGSLLLESTGNAMPLAFLAHILTVAKGEESFIPEIESIEGLNHHPDLLELLRLVKTGSLEEAANTAKLLHKLRSCGQHKSDEAIRTAAFSSLGSLIINHLPLDKARTAFFQLAYFAKGEEPGNVAYSWAIETEFIQDEGEPIEVLKESIEKYATDALYPEVTSENDWERVRFDLFDAKDRDTKRVVALAMFKKARALAHGNSSEQLAVAWQLRWLVDYPAILSFFELHPILEAIADMPRSGELKNRCKEDAWQRFEDELTKLEAYQPS